MKKFIALGVALLVLLFSFVPAANVADVDGVQVCSDLPLNPNPYDEANK